MAKSKERHIYVSVGGSDENDGSQEKPVATINKARTLARKAKKTSKTVVVHVGSGKYFIDNTIVFEPEDSNATYLAEDGTVLSGAMPLDISNWADVGNGMKFTQIESGLKLDQLFVNGVQQILCRYPNYQPEQTLQGSTSKEDIKERSANWSNPQGGYIRALHGNRWGGNSFIISGKSDSSDLGVNYQWVGDNNRGSSISQTDVMVENILEELDEENEWYYDNETGVLYFKPSPELDLSSAKFEGAVTEEIFRLEGIKGGKTVSEITFQNFTIENTKRTMFSGVYVPLMRGDWCVVRSSAIFISNAEKITVQNCHIRNIGGNAVFVSEHCKNVLIDANTIENIGSSGVIFAGHPDSCREPSFYSEKPAPEADPYYVHKTTIEDTEAGPQNEYYPRECTVSNNHIKNVGIWEKQSSHVAVSVSYKINVLHNTINTGPRAGININDGTFGGHEIAYNDVFDVQRETHDHGMFNSWGRARFWSLGGYNSGGNDGAKKESYVKLDTIVPIRIHDNRWHFSEKIDGTGTFGIDLDDGSSNYEIYNNLCLNLGIKLREGFYRKVYNNIVINGDINLHCTYENSHDIFERNIVLNGEPYVLALTGEERFRVSQSMFNNNLFYDFGTKITFPSYWQVNLGYDTGSIEDDPKFRDVSINDYTVTNESVLQKIDFKNFSMDQFGAPGCAEKSPYYEKKVSDGNADLLETQEWLGGMISALNESIMSATAAPSIKGVYIKEVPADSGIAKLGLKNNDVITHVNSIEIVKKSEFVQLYNALPNGASVYLTVIRNSMPTTISIVRDDIGELY